jgi:peroxiredoxin
MKKYKSLIIWTSALILIFFAAYVIYDKYESQMMIPPPIPDSLTESGGSDTDSDNPEGSVTVPDNTGTADKDSNWDDGGSSGNAGNTDTDDGGGTDEDVIMVPDFTLRDLDGNEVSLSDYRGKIVVLNFWAVWCKYCIEEMPDLNELDKELAEAGDALVLAVNVDEPYDTVNDYITKSNIGIKVLLDEGAHVSSDIFGVNGYPTTFIVNKDGSLYTYIPGKTDLETMHTVMDMARENAPLY